MHILGRGLGRSLARWGGTALLAALAACGDEGPVSAPGSLRVEVVSPNGAEGAALVLLVGEGVGEVAQGGAGRVFGLRSGDTTRVVVVNEAGGALDFLVAVDDTTRRPQAVLVEVSGPDDQLRALAGYAVEVGR